MSRTLYLALRYFNEVFDVFSSSELMSDVQMQILMMQIEKVGRQVEITCREIDALR
jgi:hypothetical protein